MPARVEGATYRRDVAGHRCRGVGMHREHRLDAVLAVRVQPLLDTCGVECTPPVARNLLDLGSDVLRHLAPGRREHAGGGDEHEIALADHVRERRLPGTVTVGGVEEYPTTRLEYPRQAIEAVLRSRHEVAVHQIDGGPVHRGEHAVGDVRGPRRHLKVSAALGRRVVHERPRLVRVHRASMRHEPVVPAASPNLFGIRSVVECR